MKPSEVYANDLVKNYSAHIEEKNADRFSAVLLNMRVEHGRETKAELIHSYRSYLESTLFGDSFAEAFGGVDTRKNLKELFKGSKMGETLDTVFREWDYNLSDADLWKMMCDTMMSNYQIDLNEKHR